MPEMACLSFDMNHHYLREFVPLFFTHIKQYSLSSLKKDLIAGVTVGVIALPLAMAFAIASGVTPIQGLYTAIVAGFLISFLGGSAYQVGGPTGAFVVVIYGVMSHVGYDGLVVATLIAGFLLLIAAFFKLGRFIKYTPKPLVLGFTSGIAVLIFSSQIKDFFGLEVANLPAEFLPKWIALYQAFPTFHMTTLILSSSTIGLIFLIKKYVPKLPWGITSIAIVTFISFWLELPVETILTRFGELPRTLPSFQFPSIHLSLEEWKVIFPHALTIAFLAGIESLLSAMVADQMTGTEHRSNVELMGQGLANIASVLFGGIPATGGIARTATNVKTGAVSPLSGMIHAISLAAILIVCAPVVNHVPLGALAATLMVIAWNMSEAHQWKSLFKIPIRDRLILLLTFSMTVSVDLITGITAGIGVAALFSMKKSLQNQQVR